MTEKIGLDAVFETDQFQKGMKNYLGGLKVATNSTDISAASMGKSLIGGLASVSWDVIKLGATAFLGLAAAAGGAAVAIAGVALKSIDAAGALVDLSAKTGIGVERLQELSFIGGQIGVDTETMTGSLSKLIRAMDSAKDKGSDQAAAFKLLGVEITNADGSLRNANDVWTETLSALGGVANETERDALALQLFGRSAMEMNPLIKLSAEEIEGMTRQAREMGAVVSESDVTALESFGDRMAAFQAGFKGVGARLSRGFLPALEKVMTIIEKIAKSESFAKFIDKVSEAIGKFVSKLSVVIDQLVAGDLTGALNTIFGPGIVTAITNVLTTLQSFGAWLSANWAPIVAGIAVVVGGLVIPAFIAWATAAWTAAAATIAATWPILAPILAIGAAVALLVAAWQNDWGGIRTTLTEVWTGTIQPVLQEVWNWLSTNVPAAIQTLVSFWNGVLLPAFQSVWSWVQTNIIPLFMKIGELLSVTLSVAATALAGIWQNVLGPAFAAVAAIVSDTLQPIITAASDFITNNFMPNLKIFAAFLSDKIVGGFEAVGKAISWVMGKIDSLIANLKNIHLPWWATPGSPTPFEIGVWGMGKAIKDLATVQLPKLTASLQLDPGRLSPVLATSSRSTPSVTNNRVTNNTFNLGQNTIAGGMDGATFEARVLEIVRRAI